MRAQRLRLELRMELHREIPRVPGQFDDFDELAVERTADDFQAMFDQLGFVQTVELVAMPMTLVDDFLAVEPERQ